MAERELQHIRFSIENGTWTADNTPQAGDLDPKTVTLRDLASYWRDQRSTTSGQPLSPTTLAEYRRLVEVTLSPFTNKPIRTITTQQIERWRSPEMLRAPNQTVKAYKHLKTLMTWAHKRKWIASNPCDIERGTSYRPSEPLAPNRQQVEIMFETANEQFQTVLALAAWGGLRKGEIMELRRKDIERVQDDGITYCAVNVRRGVIWENGAPKVKTPKTPKSIRRVILPSTASAIVLQHLLTLPISPEALLFSSDPEGIQHWGEFKIKPYWQKVCLAAGFVGRFHSLRAFAMTQYASQGATLQDIMDRGGHNNVETAMRYQRESGRELEFVKRLG
jgi:integrase